MIQTLFKFIEENPEKIAALVAAIYEVIVRVKPTKSNWSIIDFVFKMISIFLPNNSKDFTTVKNTQGIAKISDKHVTVIKMIGILMLFSVASFGQLNSTQKSGRYYNADSLTVKTEITGLDLMYDNVGGIYYNSQHVPGKFRIYYNHTWHDLTGGSSSSSGNNVLGSVISDNWSNLTNWTGPGVFSVTGNKLNITGGTPVSPTFANYIYNRYGTSNLELSDMETDIIVGPINATSWGVGYTLQGHTAVNTSGVTMAVLLDATNKGHTAFYFNNSVSGGVVSTGFISVNTGDHLHFVVNVVKDVISMTLTNLTTVPNQSVSQTYSYDFTTTSAKVYPSNFLYTITALGGNHQMTPFSITSNVQKKPSFCYVGDSEIKGYAGVDEMRNRSIQLISDHYQGTYTSLAGQSMQVQESNLNEILFVDADTIDISLGINNIALGQSASSVLAKIQGMIDTLTLSGKYTLGSNMFISTLRPYNGSDVTAMNTLIRSTYGTSVIDLYYPFWSGSTFTVNPFYFAPDLLHLNVYGHQVEANILANFFKLKAQTILDNRVLKFPFYNASNGFVGINSYGKQTTAPRHLLDLVNTGGGQALSISSSFSGDDALYLGSAVGGDAEISTGSYYNDAGQWIATNANSTIYAISGGIHYYTTNSGLTPGNSFSPTFRMNVSGSGLTVNNLGGGGTQMVTADNNGLLHVQAIPSGGSPANPNTSVQWNNSGSFGGTADYTYNSGSRIVTVTNGTNLSSMSPTQLVVNNGTNQTKYQDSGLTTVGGGWGAVTADLFDCTLTATSSSGSNGNVTLNSDAANFKVSDAGLISADVPTEMAVRNKASITTEIRILPAAQQIVFQPNSGGTQVTTQIFPTANTGTTVGNHIQILSGGTSGTGRTGNVIITPGASTGGGSTGWIVLQNLPTSTPCGSAPSGTLWSNSGVLTVCP